MVKSPETFLELMSEARKPLGNRRGKLAYELDVGFTTINRRRNSRTMPFLRESNQTRNAVFIRR